MIIKCKMCGGDLEFREGMTVCECEFCGTTQTIPLVVNKTMRFPSARGQLYERHGA